MDTVRAILNTRPAFLIYLNGMMVFSQLLSLWAAQIQSAPLLYAAVTLGGLAFGGVFPQIVIVTSELFGKKHAGGNIMFLNGWTGCVPALGFGKYLSQAVYHAHIRSGGDGKTCYGPGCFGMTHAIIAASCLLGILFTVMLCRKSLPLYRRIWELQHRQRQ
jgi:MFS family permease